MFAMLPCTESMLTMSPLVTVKSGELPIVSVAVSSWKATESFWAP